MSVKNVQTFATLSTAAVGWLLVVWATFVAQAWVLMFRTMAIPLPIPRPPIAISDIFLGLVMCVVRPDMAIVYSWQGGALGLISTILLVCCIPLIVSPPWGKFVVAPLALFHLYAIYLLAGNSSISPLWEWQWRLPILVLTLGVGYAASQWRRKIFQPRGEAWISERNRAKLPKSRKGGFTLVEVLVVIAILIVLAGLTFTLLSSGKRSAAVTRELSDMRQEFVAINLYEADYDHKSPSSLVDLTPTYIPATQLTCPSDVRRSLSLKDWPANPWANAVPPDPIAVASRRSPHINSYMYLKTFESRLPEGHGFDELRSDPRVGLLSGVGLMECTRCSDEECIGSCKYWWNINPQIDQGQPAANLAGSVVTVRTDGSELVRMFPDCNSNSASYHGVFFLDLRTPNCDPIYISKP